MAFPRLLGILDSSKLEVSDGIQQLYTFHTSLS